MNWLVVGLVIGAGWLFLKEKPTPTPQAPPLPTAPPKCPTQAQVLAFLKAKNIPSYFATAAPPSTWPPPVAAEWTSASRLYDTINCNLYFWNGTAWYKDTVLSTELLASTLSGHPFADSFTP
jgi:hypothetical protein